MNLSRIPYRAGLLAVLACLSPHWAAVAQEAPAPAAPRPPSGFQAARDLLDTIGTELAGDAVIQYDAETNSIIVITDEETNRQIGRVIDTLDKPVPQVLIKVLFLEVTYSKGLDLGVEGSFTFQDAAGGEEHSVMSDFGVENASRGGFYRIVDEDFRLTMRALATTGNLEVLSRPSVLTRNNETAMITIGQEVPFIRNSRITDNGQTINTVEYEDIGIILEVTPHITAERLVEMEVSPEISTLTAETVPISDTVNAQVIAKRSAETRVVVADGKTVVIGGLMEDNDTVSVSKIPILGDIPLLGALFRRTIKSNTKTELLIFLTPYVVDTVDDLDILTLREQGQTENTPKVLKTQAGQHKYIEPIDR
jgi:general secretion pathway protein D